MSKTPTPHTPDGTSGPKSKSRFWAFWTSLPGVLTAVTGLITAVAAVATLGPTPADTSHRTDPVPVADWGDRVDELCLSAARELRPIVTHASSSDLTQATAALRDLVDVIDRFGTRVEGVPIPQSHIDKRNALLAHFGNLTSAMDNLIAAAEAGDTPAVAKAQDFVVSESGKMDKILKELGATACDAIDLPA
jgi:hypothetical protein